MRAPEPSHRETARQLLSEAFDTGNGGTALGASSSRAFDALLRECQSAKSDRCHWDLVELAEKLKLTAGSRWGLHDAVAVLPTSGAEKHLRAAKRLLDQITPEQLRAEGIRDHLYFAAVLDLLRFGVDLRRTSNDAGEVQSLSAKLAEQEARAATMPLTRARRDDMRNNLVHYKKALLSSAGRHEEYAQLVAEERQRAAPDSSELAYDSIMADMVTGRMETAVAHADRLLENQSEDADILFLSAIGHLLLNDERYAESAERILLWVDYQYRDYIRLMLWWRMTERSRALASRDQAAEAQRLWGRARALLEDRLREVPVEEPPEQRLEDGDLGPWREMLIRYFLTPNEQNRRALFDPLASKEEFARSPLAKGAQQLSAYRCEAHFYEALLHAVTDGPTPPRERYLASLRAVVAEKCFRTYEMTMARWLLAREERTVPSSGN
jgi:hypothetical protein